MIEEKEFSSPNLLSGSEIFSKKKEKVPKLAMEISAESKSAQNSQKILSDLFFNSKS